MKNRIPLLMALCTLCLACQPSQSTSVEKKSAFSFNDIPIDCPEGTKRVDREDPLFPEVFCVGEDGKEGPWLEYDKDGNIRVKAQFKAGVLQGHWERYYHNGQLERSGHYENNRRSGLWKEWYIEGNKRSEKEYKEDIEHGLTKIWYRNGVLMAEGHNVDGLEKGNWKVYTPKGNLARECEMKDGNEQECIIHDKEFRINSRINENRIVIE